MLLDSADANRISPSLNTNRLLDNGEMLSDKQIIFTALLPVKPPLPVDAEDPGLEDAEDHHDPCYPF